MSVLTHSSLRCDAACGSTIHSITRSFLLRVLKFEKNGGAACPATPVARSRSGLRTLRLLFPDFRDSKRTTVIIDALAREQPAYMRQILSRAELPAESLERLLAEA